MPGSGCVFTKIDPPPEGCVNVPTISQWGAIALVLALGVMMAIRFGRGETESSSQSRP